MDFWDNEEEVEDIFDENYVEEEKNKYLADAEQAICLIAKFLSTTKEDYQKLKGFQRIDSLMDVDFLGSLRKIQLNNEAQLQLRMKNLSDRLMEEKKYQVLSNKSIVGIGGKFSAGKSKFINSLLNAREELLPEDQNPTTSIPTYLVYGKQERINAYTKDNREIILDIEAMQALTHKFYEKYQMGFSSFINSLIIMEPNMPYQNLVFLDTPGYSKADSFYQSNTQKKKTDEKKAHEQLKGVDFLIWLVDIENGGLSNTDITFIQNINIETPILIVANKADKKIEKEVKEILTQMEADAKESGIQYFAVTAYSSKDKKEWGNRKKISEFLNYVQKHQKSGENIYKQICEINERISEEISIKISRKEKERNKLTDIVFQSNDIMEIKTLIDIYGETMETIRDMKQCRIAYSKIVRNLKKSLGKQFERK